MLLTVRLKSVRDAEKSEDPPRPARTALFLSRFCTRCPAAGHQLRAGACSRFYCAPGRLRVFPFFAPLTIPLFRYFLLFGFQGLGFFRRLPRLLSVSSACFFFAISSPVQSKRQKTGWRRATKNKRASPLFLRFILRGDCAFYSREILAR